MTDFDAVAAACSLTRFFSRPLFAAIDSQNRGLVTYAQFSRCASVATMDVAQRRLTFPTHGTEGADGVGSGSICPSRMWRWPPAPLRCWPRTAYSYRSTLSLSFAVWGA
jgi:hypothetical protein